MKILQVLMSQKIYKGVHFYAEDLRNSLPEYVNIDVCHREEFNKWIRKNKLAEETKKYDLIDIHNTYPFYSVTLSGMMRKLKVPICVNFSLTLHDYCKYYLKMRDFELGYWWLKGLFSSKLDRIAALISWSQKAKEDLVSQYFVNPEKIFVVYPFVKTQNRKNNSDINKFITIGFISGHEFYRKNALLVLKAFELLCNEYRNIKLDIVTNLKLKDSDNMKVSPLTSRDKLYDFFYPNCDILLMPSQAESFGIVILEAMSFGIPVVATDIYASREIIEEGKNGFLIRENALNELLQKVRILLNNPALRLEIGERAKETVEHKFNAEKNSKKILDIYNWCIKNYTTKTNHIF